MFLVDILRSFAFDSRSYVLLIDKSWMVPLLIWKAKGKVECSGMIGESIIGGSVIFRFPIKTRFWALQDPSSRHFWVVRKIVCNYRITDMSKLSRDSGINVWQFVQYLYKIPKIFKTLEKRLVFAFQCPQMSPFLSLWYSVVITWLRRLNKTHKRVNWASKSHRIDSIVTSEKSAISSAQWIAPRDFARFPHKL